MAQIPPCTAYPPPPGYSAVPVYGGAPPPMPVLPQPPTYPDYNNHGVNTAPIPAFNVAGMVSSQMSLPYQQRLNYYPSHLTTMAPPAQPIPTVSIASPNVYNPSSYSTCYPASLPAASAYSGHGQLTSNVPNPSMNPSNAQGLSLAGYNPQSTSVLVYHASKADVPNISSNTSTGAADPHSAYGYIDPSRMPTASSSIFNHTGLLYPTSGPESVADTNLDRQLEQVASKSGEPKTSKQFDQYYMNLKSFKSKEKNYSSYPGGPSGEGARSKKQANDDEFDSGWDARSSISVGTNYTNPGDDFDSFKRTKSDRLDRSKRFKSGRDYENYTNDAKEWYKPSSKLYGSGTPSRSSFDRSSGYKSKSFSEYETDYEPSNYIERADMSCVRVEYDGPDTASYKRRNVPIRQAKSEHVLPQKFSGNCPVQKRNFREPFVQPNNKAPRAPKPLFPGRRNDMSRKYDNFDEEMYPNKRWEKEFLKWLNDSDEEAEEKRVWIRSSPSELYYIRDEVNPKIIKATTKLKKLCEKFSDSLAHRSANIKSSRPEYKTVVQPSSQKCSKKKGKEHNTYDSDSSSSCSEGESDAALQELERKKNHPDRLHPELWYNDVGEMNDGPVCRCSLKARKSGIRHGFYAGENHLPPCDPYTNNADRLYHYRITISPPTNFLVRIPTVIDHDGHEFIFEGFSLLSHFPLERFPTCSVIRFNIQYTILYLEEQMPENFTIMELNLFSQYIFYELLEMVDLELKAAEDTHGCDRFHILPRFVRLLEDNGKEVLSMNKVLIHLLESNQPLIPEPELANLAKMSKSEWYNYIDKVKGMLVMYPGKKPSCIRVDQIDKENLVNSLKDGKLVFPELIHFGIRPPQLSYAGNPEYQKRWREYVRLRHLLANKPKPTYEDKRKLEARESELQKMRLKVSLKRDVTVVLSSEGFFKTGIMCDLVQHAMLLPVLICHLRFHLSLSCLESRVGYHFTNRSLLQLALTHPSYRENFGTNPDHARNSLTNCGIRHPEYGDRRVHYQNTRKRGINTLIQIMSRFGKQKETESNISHNERLEFLGDAVVEFLTTIHLFFMFPTIEEGGLATYRAAIVQNQHLAVLAQKLELEKYLLYAHGSDLCHESELRHAMANCFEALMGALFLDGGLRVTDKVFSETLYRDEPDLLDLWVNLPPHPLQEQEPEGDRKWIEKIPFLQKLTKFEDETEIQFRHVRLLARAFTDRSVGYNDLTMGSNQRLEFLGDTVLQLIASEYLYKHFPEHHEGHLSLLRSSLVNNCTQSVVCDDLGMTGFAVYRAPKLELKVKDRADLLEAYLGALFIDKGLHYCWKFCEVCFFPRLQQFILKQEWNDPKSKLQQCCLTLRSAEGGEPDIPVYKVLECKGPTNMRVYTVAVYFRSKRLAKALGTSIQAAEMNAAKAALEASQNLFPQLAHQQRIVKKMLGKDLDCDDMSYKLSNKSSWTSEHSKLPQSYRKASRKSKPKSEKSGRDPSSSKGKKDKPVCPSS